MLLLLKISVLPQNFLNRRSTHAIESQLSRSETHATLWIVKTFWAENMDDNAVKFGPKVCAYIVVKQSERGPKMTGNFRTEKLGCF